MYFNLHGDQTTAKFIMYQDLLPCFASRFLFSLSQKCIKPSLFEMEKEHAVMRCISRLAYLCITTVYFFTARYRSNYVSIYIIFVYICIYLCIIAPYLK